MGVKESSTYVGKRKYKQIQQINETISTITFVKRWVAKAFVEWRKGK